MSTVNKDSTSKKKPRLPTGWAVYPSKTYPNRVYYFNSFTGCTTWDKPPVGCDDEEDSDESSDVRRRSSDNSDIESRAASSSSSLRHTTSESEKKPDSTVSSERNKTMRNGINDNVHVNKKTPSTSSLFDVKDLCQNKVDNHGEKRQWKEGSLTGSKTNLENSPLKKLKLNFASSSDTSEKRTDSDSDVRNQTDLLLRLGGDASSGSPKKSCVELPEDDLRHILKAKRNRKHKKCVEVPKSEAQETSPANSGLAARRLSDLQSKLAEERRKREKCEEWTDVSSYKRRRSAHNVYSHSVGEEVNESEQSAWSFRIESRTSWTNYNDKQSSQPSRSPQSSQTATLAKVRHEVNRPQLSSPSPKAELRISEKNCGVSPLFQVRQELRRPWESPLTSKTEPQTQVKSYSVSPEEKKVEQSSPPSQVAASKKGASKCLAAKRLESLQKKLALQQKNSKQSDFQSASIESTNNNKGLKMNVTSPTLSINKYGSRTFDTVSTKEQVDVEKIDADNSFTQELMEWEPIEEEKILSHIQEVRNQIQQDGGINPDEIMQKPDYETMSVFCESGKTEWFIVLDTNILLSSLTYVEELRDTNFKGLGFPILIIPWQVLQELDILKDQRGGGKNSSVTARARKAVSFLHSNFVTKHPRVRGQSALDAFPQDFKMEVPDDAILQCCLHIVHRTQQVILLSNDKNLCNKAIVNGIRAYQKSEIEQALQGFHPDSIGEVPNNSAGNAGLSDSRVDTSTLICDTQEEREASKADLIICKLKSVLKDLLSRVLENEMNKVYGQSWLKVIAIKPPWTLSEILVCMLKHWIAVLGFVLPSNIKPSLESLQTFFAKTTGYGHSISDIKKILKTSAKLCESIHNNEYSNYVSSCISSIEKLQQYCEATENLRRSPVKTQTEDLNPVIETLEKCWNSVHSFCAITCDILNMKHNFTYVRPDPMPTVDFVRDNLPDVYPRVHALTKAILRIEQFPVSNLDVNNEAIRSLYTTLTNLMRSNEVDETFTPELVLKFCTVPNTRQMLIKAGTMFKEIQAILDTAINRLVQSGMA